MNMKLEISVLIVSAFVSGQTLAGDGEASKSRIGPGKAVVEAQEVTGIKLSEKATHNLELQVTQVVQAGTVTIPPTALIKFQDFFGIYRKREGWFKMIEVEPRSANGKVTISSKELKNGDEVVTTNADLLRVVDLDVWGPEADACVD
jgi:hypothetical protein